MIRLFAISLALILAFGCGTQNQLTETQVEVKNAPEWVNTRPLSGQYYVGVAAASKVREPLEYANVAKKNALNDLASEISVEIKGESLLNTLEVNRNFHEEFISTISTSPVFGIGVEAGFGFSALGASVFTSLTGASTGSSKFINILS